MSVAKGDCQMGTPYLGEVKLISWNFPPKGWAFCNGQTLPINQNQALFSLFGTLYGGNGQTTFAIPNLRGQVPIHMGNGHTQGETAGSSSVTINQQTMTQHLHVAQGTSTNADTPVPTGNFLGAANNMYGPANAGGLTNLDPTTITTGGGSQPHDNRQPVLTITFCA